MAGVQDPSTNTRDSWRAHKWSRRRAPKTPKTTLGMYWLRGNIGNGTATDQVTSKQPVTEPVITKAAQGEVVPPAGGGVVRNSDTTTEKSKTKKTSFTESTSTPKEAQCALLHHEDKATPLKEELSSGPVPECQKDCT